MLPKISKQKNKNVLLYLVSRWDLLILSFLISIYTIVFSTFSILRHNAFASYFDLGNMDHTMWNTLHGDFFSFRYADEIVSRLAFHADFILVLLSPLYLIWDDVRILLIAQSFLLGIGAIPAYLLSVKILKSRRASLLIVAAYLLNPAMQWTNIYDFHGISLAVPFLLFSFYFAYSKKWKLYFLFIFLSLITKENVSLLVFMIGVSLIVFREYKKAFVTMIIGVAWFVTTIFVVIPHFSVTGGTHWAFEWYGGVTSENTAIPSFSFLSPRPFFSPESIQYYLVLLKTYGFLPLLGLPWLLLSLPEIAINTLSSNAAMRNIMFHYDSGIIPFLVLGTIFGIRYVQWTFNRTRFSQFSSFVIISLGILLVLAAARMNYNYGPLPITPWCWCQMYHVSSEDKHFEGVLQNLPDDASITTSLEIKPHVAHRREVYLVPSATSSARFVALQMQHRIVGNFGEKELEGRVLRAMNENIQYRQVYRSKNFYLFERVDY